MPGCSGATGHPHSGILYFGPGSLFSVEQVEIIHDWMEKAISRRYGTAQYVTPLEGALHEKLNSFTGLLTKAQDNLL
ncbi:MAG: hypothetical protein JXA71_10025 [Chitinispirillaceae bacterium]|nr:hypothetical protein [Chitinispirillaceae bacterium]